MPTIVRILSDVKYTQVVAGRKLVYDLDTDDIIELTDDALATDLIALGHAEASLGPVTTTEADKGIFYPEEPEPAGTVSIVDDLVSFDTDRALSANQGRILRNMIQAAGAGTQVPGVVDGQTVIALPAVPTDATSVVVEVNGIRYRPTSSFTVAGSTVTWLNGFSLSASDIVFVSYI